VIVPAPRSNHHEHPIDGGGTLFPRHCSRRRRGLGRRRVGIHRRRLRLMGVHLWRGRGRGLPFRLDPRLLPEPLMCPLKLRSKDSLLYGIIEPG